MSHKRNSDGIISYSKEKHNKSIKDADDAIASRHRLRSKSTSSNA